ncbi:MAG: lipoyl synthase [Chloroflexota bacterium]|nr:lipoyl synthase [Chloroflexota bacterium]
MPNNPTRDRLDPETIDTTPKRRPSWLKVRAPSGENYANLQHLMRSKELHTVCEEAGCPNIGECWGSGTATFLMLGDVCTRTCRFCAVKHGRPGPLDWDEAERVAQAVKNMRLRHAVITSVNRDERRDGGAPIFAMVIRRIRQLLPGCSVEVLIPDFKGSIEALRIVMAAHPEILNHNVDTVPRLVKQIKPQNRCEWSQAILTHARMLDPEVLTKSGIMVGLGETFEEVQETMRDLAAWGVDILTIGQYLQPSRKHLAIQRYYEPAEFAALKEFGLALGFKWVESAPLVRSSYHAGEQVRALSVAHQKQ